MRDPIDQSKAPTKPMDQMVIKTVSITGEIPSSVLWFNPVALTMTLPTNKQRQKRQNMKPPIALSLAPGLLSEDCCPECELDTMWFPLKIGSMLKENVLVGVQVEWSTCSQPIARLRQSRTHWPRLPENIAARVGMGDR